MRTAVKIANGLTDASYDDPDAAPGASCFYRVKAVNAAGASAYSKGVAAAVKVTSGTGTLYHYTYDAAGNLTQMNMAPTADQPSVVLTAAYDAVGNRTSLSATVDAVADFVNTWTYDQLNRVTEVTQTGQSGGNEVADKRVDIEGKGVRNL